METLRLAYSGEKLISRAEPARVTYEVAVLYTATGIEHPVRTRASRAAARMIVENLDLGDKRAVLLVKRNGELLPIEQLKRRDCWEN